MIHLHLRHQTSGALLKLAVLGRVDERVDEAVAEHQHGQEMVVPTGEVDDMAAVADSNQELVRSETYDKSAANHQRGNDGVASGSACCWSSIGSNLK